MTMLTKIIKDRRFHRLAGVMVLLLAGLGLLAWKMGVDGAQLKGWWKQAESFLAAHPGWLFAALVVLPGMPVPTSALLFLAGSVWHDQPLWACVVCLIGIGMNLTWTYWFAAVPGRKLVERLIVAGELKIPEVKPGNHMALLLLLRLTPGFPLFLQNYLLGFFRVPFRLYLGVSICCTGLISCGVVLSGAGIADGHLMPVITGVALIVLGGLLVRWVKSKWLKSTTHQGEG